MWTLISQLKADGVTIILTTHYIDEAEAIADRIAVMKGGMGLPATVRDIEYLGATVSVALQADQLGELTAVLPDGRFFADPVAPGEQVMLAWKPEDAHRLAA